MEVNGEMREERWTRKEQQALDQLPFTRAQVKGFREIFVENVPLAGLLTTRVSS